MFCKNHGELSRCLGLAVIRSWLSNVRPLCVIWAHVSYCQVRISGGRAIYGGLPDSFLWLEQGRMAGIPVLVILMLLIVAGAWFVMEHTIFGRHLYAVGGNMRAAELSRISGRFYRAAGLIASALFATVSGFLLASRLGSGQLNAGQNYLLDGLATVFIGVINNSLNLMGMDSFVQSIVKGVIIVVAVSVISRTTKLRILQLLGGPQQRGVMEPGSACHCHVGSMPRAIGLASGTG